MTHQLADHQHVLELFVRVLAVGVAQRVGRHARAIEGAVQSGFGVRPSAARQKRVWLMGVALACFVQQLEGFGRQSHASGFVRAVADLVSFGRQADVRRFGIEADLGPLQQSGFAWPQAGDQHEVEDRPGPLSSFGAVREVLPAGQQLLIADVFGIVGDGGQARELRQPREVSALLAPLERPDGVAEHMPGGLRAELAVLFQVAFEVVQVVVVQLV